MLISFVSNFVLLSLKSYTTVQQILQPTPLVLALRNQLIGQIAEKDQLHPQALADNQQQDSAEEGWANEDKVSPDVRKETETRALPSESLTVAPQVSIEMR